MAETNSMKDKDINSNGVAEENKIREFILNKDISASNIETVVKGILEINRYDNRKQEEEEGYIRKPIHLVVDSFGGSIYCGLLLINVIENSDTPVHGYCYSKAMSMGLAIFNACHKRFASPNATLMYHDAGTTLGDTLEGIKQGVEQLKRVIKRLDSQIVEYTNDKITQRQLDKIKREKKNWYIFGDDAFELGLVDELLESKRNKHRY